jgi:hypothetical protein
MLVKVFFSWFLGYAPLLFSGAILLIVLLNYFFKKRTWLKSLIKIETKKLIIILLGATIFYNLLLSVLQYFVWQGSAFTRFFLPPFQSLGYFLGYAGFHFWFAGALTFISALIFFLIFKLLRKYRTDIISQEELNLLLLSGLLVSWPKIIILVLLFLLITLFWSIVNLLVFKKKNNNLSLPLILSLVTTFILGNYLIIKLSLTVLAV